MCSGNFGKIWKYWFVGGSGAEPTEASENITKLVKKSKENYKILKLHEILANFDLKKLGLIKIKAIWKDFIILKESKKPSDKFLRAWAKNQLRFEIFEKTLKFTCKNLNGKLIFYPFFTNFLWFFHFIHLWNIPKYFGVACGGSFAGLGGTF